MVSDIVCIIALLGVQVWWHLRIGEKFAAIIPFTTNVCKTVSCTVILGENIAANRYFLVKWDIRLKQPSFSTTFSSCFQKVPSRFRWVVEQTLREFFKSIQLGKDLDPSWKKQIYKVIARLDDYVPDYFKTQTFLDQLE